MIKSIAIKNFQSHANTEIDFHPGVNVIVGRSDSGKSAIMRALYWAFFNRPIGDSYIRKGSKITAVGVDFDNGQMSRVRENNFNGYFLGLHDSYKGFSHNIPEPVSNFVNMSRINFQHQMDSPFMLSWTAGQRGSFINDTVNLESMDMAVSNIKRKIKEEIRSIESNTQHMEQMQKELDAFEDLEEIESLIEDLENKQDRLNCLNEKHLELSSIIDDIHDAQICIEENEEKVKAQQPTIQAYKILDKYKELENGALELVELLSMLESIEIQIQNLYQDIKKSTNEFNELMPEICPLCGE